MGRVEGRIGSDGRVHKVGSRPKPVAGPAMLSPSKRSTRELPAAYGVSEEQALRVSACGGEAMHRRVLMRWLVIALAIMSVPFITHSLDIPNADPVSAFIGTATLFLGLYQQFPQLRQRLRFRRGARDQPDPAEVLNEIMAQRLAAEEIHARVQEPAAIEVPWTNAEPGLSDLPANVMKLSAARSLPSLAGRSPEVAAVFSRLPARRLVILGRPGAGKSVLARRLCRDLASLRQPGDPVPAVVYVGAWSPRREPHFPTWLAKRLASDHPVLARVARGGNTLAQGLVNDGMVLPVLDGLDELSDSAQEAIVTLNDTLPAEWGCIITCRTDEYIKAAEIRPLAASAAIELLPLGLRELRSYLPRTAKAEEPEARATGKWQPLLDKLSGTDGYATQNLLQVLSSPLMVMLARCTYSDTSRDPMTLLDAASVSTEQVERELLEGWIPFAYRPSTSPRIPVADARMYLTRLARAMRRAGTHEILWWRMPGVSKWVTHGLAPLVLGLLAGGFFAGSTWLRFAIEFGADAGGQVIAQSGPFDAAMGACVAIGFWHVGALARAMQDVSRAEVSKRGKALANLRSGPTPEVVGRRSGNRRRGAPGRVVAAALAVGVSAVATLGGLAVVIALIRGAGPLVDDPRRTLPLWFGLGTGMGLVYGLGRESAAPLVLRYDPLPLAEVIATDRFATLLRAMFPTLAAFTLFASISSTLSSDIILPAMLSAGTIGVSYGLGGSAWCRLCIGRLWMAATGQSPLRLITLLDDAHQRGVLRRDGQAYRFRHSSLERHLGGAAGPD
jgi:hypothetical protein